MIAHRARSLPTTLWYIREVDPTLLLHRADPRRRLPAEDGEVSAAVNNFRFASH